MPDSAHATRRVPPPALRRDPVSFTLLGQLEVRKDGTDHAPTAPKVLQVLGMLLARPGQVVHVDSLVEELWDSTPPRSVRTTMQTYVYHLRQCIEQRGLAANGEERLSTSRPGYLLRIDPSQVDVFAFRRRCSEGREQLHEGRHSGAARSLREALALWSGPPLANVKCGPVLSAFAADLQEQYRNAQHMRIEAEIAMGAHRELIGELRRLVAANSLDEVLWGQLMRVLGHCGRRAEAVDSYRRLRAGLASELGVEPCDEIQSLHRQLTAGGVLR